MARAWQPSRSELPETRDSGALVIVAEDDPDDRLLLDEAFQDAGVLNPRVFVSDGLHLLELLRSRRAMLADISPLVILDLNMPRMDGRRVLEELRRDPALAGIPVVVLTTSSAPGDIADCIRKGARAYVPKPVSYHELVNVVHGLASEWLAPRAVPRARTHTNVPGRAGLG